MTPPRTGPLAGVTGSSEPATTGVHFIGNNPVEGYVSPQAARAIEQSGRQEAHGTQPGFITNELEAGEGALQALILPGSSGTEKALRKAGLGPGPGETVKNATERPVEHAEAGGVETAEHVPGFVSGIVELLQSYGSRLLEILAGAALVGFGLVTIVRGRPPSLPKAVPVPVPV